MPITESQNGKMEDNVMKQMNSRKDLPAFGTRHTLALMGFLGIAVVYSMRVNLSVAIVAMVNNTKSSDTNDSLDACPYPDNYLTNQSIASTGEFDWDEKTQGLILGSFFYGYALTNFFGGRASEVFGSRLVVGIGIVLTGIFTMLSPLAARTSSGTFIALRILEGLTEGVTFPGMTKIIADYYPQQERSKFTSAVFLGAHFGTVVTLIVSGFLCDSDFLGGWPSVFYIFGALGLVWGVFWFWLIRDDPSKHPRISKIELDYILEGIPDAGKKKAKVPVPWKSIFTCVEFYAVAAMHFGYNWGFYTLLTQLPTYLDQILHYSMKSNGVLSSLPYLGTLIAGVIYSAVIDQLIIKKKISIINVRRLSMISAGYGPALMLLLMCVVNCHSTWAMVILVMSGIFSGPHPCGFLSSYADISPRFAGTLIGVANTFATIPGFISPTITGILTLDNETLWAWRQVFMLTTIVMVITTTFYIVKIDVKVKKWNSIPSDADHKDTDMAHTNDGFSAESNEKSEITGKSS